MDYYIEKEKVKKSKVKNREDKTEENSNEVVTVHVLYQNGYKIGYVRYIDYRNNDSHGYAIRTINQNLLDQFQKEAKERFPNSENPYIRFLDLLFPMKKTKGGDW